MSLCCPWKIKKLYAFQLRGTLVCIEILPCKYCLTHCLTRCTYFFFSQTLCIHCYLPHVCRGNQFLKWLMDLILNTWQCAEQNETHYVLLCFSEHIFSHPLSLPTETSAVRCCILQRYSARVWQMDAEQRTKKNSWPVQVLHASLQIDAHTHSHTDILKHTHACPTP